jgi:hypothetical protein
MIAPAILILMLGAGSAAKAEGPTADTIVARAVQLIGHREPRRCRMHALLEVLEPDPAAKIQHGPWERNSGFDVEIEEISTGAGVERHLVKEKKLGIGYKDSSADHLVDEVLIPTPLSSPKIAARHRFTLLRRDSLWGHPVFVIGVKAADGSSPYSRDGTLWIDANTFVELKAELALPGDKFGAQTSRNPWTYTNVQEQYAWQEGVGAVPTFFKVERGGLSGASYLRSAWRTSGTITWLSCEKR